ncbi:unnamed protein product [Rotaria sp. Silwood1]|nr:unnamed protein product [Rotaria sp. Silwood1]CAF3363688.1 unnamed protein product [Rotaria sp. Silwood1]CAF3364277.1 unnamed protein product [Rotaria sp. Silwood1]CAF3370107.1 unnamed protein product [Rotaria sp. Silwood1]CAF3404760.1 unnamed protein product [Rotaria sp. Silwood1]
MTMYLTLLLVILILVLQQTIYVESSVTQIQLPNNENRRLNTIQRLRAPLMGRSLLSVTPTNVDDGSFINDVSSNSNASDDELVVLTKRRHGSVPLFGRRWIFGKRRGPLYG